MNQTEAKEILLLYRAGIDEADDPRLVEALALAQDDPELGRWFEEHRAFQRVMRAKFQQIKVPAHLRTALLAQMQRQRKIIQPAPWWRQPAWLAAAAAVFLVFGFALWWLRPSIPDRFANYQARMVSGALRAYQMDIETNDMQAVRQTLAAHGAPADYTISKGLEQLKLTGGGALHWRNNPVSMVCFDRGGKKMLFLFVMDRAAVKDPPPLKPQTAMIRGLFTASWTQGDKTYLLAGPEEPDFLQKYF
jgi:hypothetical protein